MDGKLEKLYLISACASLRDMYVGHVLYAHFGARST